MDPNYSTLIICLVACGASLLTLFSGFGLGTILVPAFGLFFPLPLAIALTGIVHLLNNLFKLSLLGKQANRDIVLRFGLPSVLGGFIGAVLLSWLSRMPVLTTWQWNDKTLEISLLKLILAIVMIFFALMELVPYLKKLAFAQQYLSLGGLLSGFFGGLSGHQGALRSAFLVQMGLEKSQYIATGVVVACMVDLTRLPVYFSRFSSAAILEQWPLLLMATLSAFVGAYLGAKFLKKVTLGFVQALTALMIIGIAVLLGLGVI